MNSTESIRSTPSSVCAPSAASLAALIGLPALGRACSRWIDPANEHEFAEIAHKALAGFQAVHATL